MPDGRTDRARLVFWLQAASLAATAWMVWRFSFRPQLFRHSFTALMTHSLGLALIAALWGAVITLALLVTIAHVEHERAWRVTLRTSAAAIWFAPATILLTAASPAYLAAALVLVISTTRLLYAQWRQVSVEPEVPIVAPEPVLVAGGIQTGFLPRHPGMALSAGLAAQATATAWVMGASGLGAALFALTVAILTIFAISSGVLKEQQPSLPRSFFGFALTILLAVGLMVGGLGGHGFGGEYDPAAEEAANLAKGHVAHPVNYGLAKSGDFPGVILRPERRAVPLLVEPIPRNGKIASRAPSRPFSIPFDGEYWMYRWPFSRPPAGSYLYQGTPTDTSYRTTDDIPLRMDAHQLLEREIDLSCCRSIQIEILNADTHPNSVAMELFVADRGGRPVSLGIKPVQSQPNESRQPVEPVAETLEYAVAPMNFDEIKVSFHRMRSREGRSARIAISRFLLMPR